MTITVTEMALQKSAEIFRPLVAAPILALQTVIPNQVRNPQSRISEGNFEMGSIVNWWNP
jgi:hypothetical protein